MKSLKEFGSLRKSGPFPEKTKDGYPERTADPFDDSGQINPSGDKGGIPFGNPNTMETPITNTTRIEQKFRQMTEK